MARALLDPPGVGFDIHGGGADLIFPHHENEIAQSEPLMAQPPMANFWVHGGLLLFDNRKMAKSLGNFEPLIDLLQRHDPQAIRWLFLQTGYRKVMNFTEDSITAAALGLSRIKAGYRSLYRPERSGQNSVVGSVVEGRTIDEKLEAVLDDDMNTAAALAVLFEFIADLPDPDADPTRAAAALDALDYWLPILGIEPNASWLAEPAVELPADFTHRLQSALSMELDGMMPPEAVERVVALRTQARLEKNWGESDRLRDALARCGVELKDGKEGTTWRVAPS
jgi:cysteinyl-tRNA synthetase